MKRKKKTLESSFQQFKPEQMGVKEEKEKEKRKEV